MSVKVSGGIVTYNNAQTIMECVRSILVYTKNCDFSLYVYDNGSKDDTVRILKQHFPEITVIEGAKNLGFGQGHNQILKHVRSDLHVIINPDIYLDDDVISYLAEYLQAHPQVVQVTPEIRNLDGSVQHLPKKDPTVGYVLLSKFPPFAHYRRRYTREDEVMTGPTQVLSCTGCFSMVRTDVIKKVHGYDRRFFLYFEDADLSRRLREYGTLIYHPEVFVYHAWKRDNTRSLRGIRNFTISMMKYYRKWHT